MTIIDVDQSTSDESLDKMSAEDRREYHKTFVEIAYLSLLVNLYTDYCIFFDYSGHVWSCRVSIRQSKARYSEDVADTEFKCLANPDEAKYDWRGIEWLKRKRDMLREILETKKVPVEKMTREVVETYVYGF